VHDPISYLQALILGLTQGIAEPFPVSSLGHGVIIPSLFGWNIHQNDDYFLAFLVATHCATAIVLFFYFFADWMRIFKGLGRSIRDRRIGDACKDELDVVSHFSPKEGPRSFLSKTRAKLHHCGMYSLELSIRRLFLGVWWREDLKNSLAGVLVARLRLRFDRIGNFDD